MIFPIGRLAAKMPPARVDPGDPDPDESQTSSLFSEAIRNKQYSVTTIEASDTKFLPRKRRTMGGCGKVARSRSFEILNGSNELAASTRQQMRGSAEDSPARWVRQGRFQMSSAFRQIHFYTCPQPRYCRFRARAEF